MGVRRTGRESWDKQGCDIPLSIRDRGSCRNPPPQTNGVLQGGRPLLSGTILAGLFHFAFLPTPRCGPFQAACGFNPPGGSHGQECGLLLGPTNQKADTPGVTHMGIWTLKRSHTRGGAQFWCHRLGKGHLGSETLQSREVASTCLGRVGDLKGMGSVGTRRGPLAPRLARG